MNGTPISHLVWLAAPLFIGCATTLYACIIVSRRAKRKDKIDQRQDSRK
jgi:ABC-type antimicrobial peptide transport system permease subunit